VSVTSDIELKRFSVGSYDNNVYILVDSDTRESVLFDAPTDAPRIMDELRGTSLKYILMTHTDFDHVQALREVKQATGAPVGVHRADAGNLPIPADFEIDDGDTFTVGSVDIRAISTPGHTPGSMCFLVGDDLIAGDTLFPGGPGSKSGRLSSAEFDRLIESIRTKLFPLPDDTRVYPGHGKPTTIGAERPHLQEWIDRGW
jgi:glyoxylase-like metal-dependent hydrolase (beta-lactamase superfamily II)